MFGHLVRERKEMMENLAKMVNLDLQDCQGHKVH
jgi:hypothetical protein